MQQIMSDDRRFYSFVVTFLARAFPWLYKCVLGIEYGMRLYASGY